ncbi:MAG: acyl-CoA dehydrogenase family protein [Firmicutes bacterium]|nr:acyl-CoA dehydrogenase family protein [Bacillota bacterium]MCL5039679.1 acyl-CoA dehydrogenase family protein [Bacillota bacterium]
MGDLKYKGGSFLLASPKVEDIFIPEEFTSEQKMMADTGRSFVENEVIPLLPSLEAHEFENSVKLLRRAGELGLLSVEIPEEYGGLGLDKITATLVTESMAPAASFGVTLYAHVGIGTLPIVYFGNKGQKAKYLPALATGEKVSAYALTEPSAGSDALGIRTTATLSPDGKHYVLNGTKQFITNAGFADLFITYAKIDGEKFTCFLVERDTPGVSLGREEEKMGIKGSSTRQVIFDEVKVPVENVLGEIGRGHIIAFDILDIGRWKLGAGAVGSAKDVIRLAAQYARVRTQFGRSLSDFRLIQEKLAEMTVRTYAAESAVYRTAGLIEDAVSGINHDAPDYFAQAAKSIAEYAIEASINKVHGSEVLNYVVDEGVQIHGGYGYTQEYAVERYYRDSRINRIFEGTNEINRLLIPGTLVRRALKGELPIMPVLLRLQDELMNLAQPSFSGAVLEQEKYMLEMAKKMALMVSGLAVQKYQQKLEGEQEILTRLADMVIEIYAMESSLVRAEKAVQLYGLEAAANKVDMSTVYVHENLARIEDWAKTCLAAMEEGDMLRTQLSILRRLTRYTPVNLFSLKRRIAARVIEAERYLA